MIGASTAIRAITTRETNTLGSPTTTTAILVSRADRRSACRSARQFPRIVVGLCAGAIRSPIAAWRRPGSASTLGVAVEGAWPWRRVFVRGDTQGRQIGVGTVRGRIGFRPVREYPRPGSERGSRAPGPGRRRHPFRYRRQLPGAAPPKSFSGRPWEPAVTRSWSPPSSHRRWGKVRTSEERRVRGYSGPARRACDGSIPTTSISTIFTARIRPRRWRKPSVRSTTWSVRARSAT